MADTHDTVPAGTCFDGPLRNNQRVETVNVSLSAWLGLIPVFFVVLLLGIALIGWAASNGHNIDDIEISLSVVEGLLAFALAASVVAFAVLPKDKSGDSPAWTLAMLGLAVAAFQFWSATAAQQRRVQSKIGTQGDAIEDVYEKPIPGAPRGSGKRGLYCRTDDGVEHLCLTLGSSPDPLARPAKGGSFSQWLDRATAVQWVDWEGDKLVATTLSGPRIFDVETRDIRNMPVGDLSGHPFDRAQKLLKREASVWPLRWRCDVALRWCFRHIGLLLGLCSVVTVLWLVWKYPQVLDPLRQLWAGLAGR